MKSSRPSRRSGRPPHRLRRLPGRPGARRALPARPGRHGLLPDVLDQGRVLDHTQDRLPVSHPYRPRLRLAGRRRGTWSCRPGFLYPALNAAARAAGVKMILSLGGWGNCAGFPGMSATAANRDPVHRASSSTSARPTPTTASTSTGSSSRTTTEKANFTLFIEALAAAFQARIAGPPRDHGRSRRTTTTAAGSTSSAWPTTSTSSAS
ncbi:MAG: hypothetical protein M0C28_47935 [Candidatus Moduliflexus flocculans]|nr:hypothetical protein [Candidatus Moduliflexus flocculans]